MATPTLKHGSHRFALALPSIAAGATNDTNTDAMMTFDFSYGTYAVYDPTQESIVRATLVANAAVTGAATNNFAVNLAHYNSAGVLVDQVFYTFALGTNAVAFTPIDLTAAAAGTGRTFVQGWLITAGDTIRLSRLTNGTGLASPAMSVTFAYGVPN